MGVIMDEMIYITKLEKALRRAIEIASTDDYEWNEETMSVELDEMKKLLEEGK
jgi:hypothetical protein